MKKHFKTQILSLLVCIVTLFGFKSEASGITAYWAVASGNTSGAIWSLSPVGPPMTVASFGSDALVFINPGITVVNDRALMQFDDLFINPGATFDMGLGNTIELWGDLVDLGTLIPGDGTFHFKGTGLQQIDSSNPLFEIHNILADNPGVVATSSPIRLTGLLEVRSGMFLSNGNLTVASDATNTGMIGQLTPGSFFGDVTIERYHDVQAQDWVMMGSGVHGQTIESWNDDFVTTGFTGSDYPSYNFNNIRTYDESVVGHQDLGFVGASNTTDAVTVGKGHFVYMNTGAVTFDVTGALQIGTFIYPITYNNTGVPVDDGWNLVSNPYPCFVDWDEPTGWTKSKVNDAIAVFDASIRNYATYIGGVGNNGGSSIIPSSQGFWVQTNGLLPDLQIHETAKTTAPAQFRNSSELQIFRLAISNDNFTDQTTLVLNNDAGIHYETNFDALKMPVDESLPSLASQSSDEVELSINAFPAMDSETEIFFNAYVPEDGMYIISFEGASGFYNGSCLVFEDLENGNSYGISEMENLLLTLSSDFEGPRFVLRMSQSVIANKVNNPCPNMSIGSIEVQGNGDGPWDYTWMDSNENIITQELASTSSSEISGLEAGVYYVQVSNNGDCPITETSVVIEDPIPLASNALVLDALCPSSDDGMISLDITGGLEPYDIVWSSGETTNTISSIPVGEYSLTIVDANNCQFTESIEVVSQSDLHVEFETVGESFILMNGLAVVDLYNTSENAEEYEWNFGDNTLNGTEEHATHAFNQAGEFEITLTGSDADCESQFSETILIIDSATMIDEIGSQNEMTAMMNDEGIFINLELDDIRNLEINVYNVLGQMLVSPIHGQYEHEQIHIKPSHIRSALISITDKSNNEMTILKVAY